MKRVKHYLISLPLADELCAHCYLMTNDPRRLEMAVAKMMHEVEARIGPVRVPLLMSTELDAKGVKTVCKALQGRDPEADRLRAAATDFHVSMWVMSAADPSYAGLMAMH